MKPNTIKLPFLTPRQVDYGNWKCYVGKTFYDKGTEPDSDDDEDVEPFEAGEFIVKAVTTGNNYICERVGSSEDQDVFDIGYVIQQIRIYEEK